jgi:DNA-binding winged helix-turn-helix (wHTH) protein/tetratricopeptide (TPR) repeat protein
MTVATSSSAEKRPYQFDDFLLDPVRRVLLRQGEPVPVTPKALSILLLLIERRGEVVDKEELLRQVWPETFVTEANLTQNVSALRKALGEKVSEHRYVVTVPGRGYCFVAEVAAVPPEPGRMEDPGPAAALPPEGPPPPDLQAGPARLRGLSTRQRAGLAVAALAVLATGIVAVLSLVQEPKPAGATDPAGGNRRPSIAVLSFRDLSGSRGSQWLASALAEMLTTELAAGGGVRVASGENVARARQTSGSESLDPKALRRLHAILGCDLLVTGSYLPLRDEDGRRLRLDLRVLRVPDGDVVASLAEVGTEAELFELVSHSGARLRAALGIAGLSPEQVRAARALQPASPEAARLYTQGLERLRAFDAPGAVELLRQAVEADPGSATLCSALAQAWSALGYDARAKQAADKAVRLSAGLPRQERLAIEARSYQVSRQWGKASAIYRTLWTFFPDDLEYGLQLARSLSEGGRDNEALRTIAELHEIPPPAGRDPRIDLTEARAALRTSDLPRSLQASRRAAAKGDASGEDLIVAQALLLEGAALLQQGEPDAAIRTFEKAGTLFGQAGDSWGAMAIRNDLARVALAEGDAAEASRLAAEAAAWWRERAIPWGEAHAVSLQAEALARRGKLAGASTAAARARTLIRGSEDRDLVLAVVPRLAFAEAAGGNAARALRDLRQAAAEARRRGLVAAELEARLRMGEIGVGQGDPAARSGLEALRSEAAARGFRLVARQAGEVLASGVHRTPPG